MSNVIEKNLNGNGVLKLSLNRPDVLNAMNADLIMGLLDGFNQAKACLLYTSPSPRDRQKSRMPSSA